MQNNLVMTSSPHLRDHSSTQRIMQEVCLALLPAGIAGVIIFGWSALMLICVSVATCVLSEFVWEKLTKRTVTIGDWSAVVTGLLLAYNLPANAPWWLAVVGGVIAIILVKQMFGGIGSNFMNPALTARAILFVSWSALMSSYPQSNFVVDATTSATPLGLLSKGVSGVNFMDLLLGNCGGVLGETCKLAILVGGIYLCVRKIADWRIPVSFIATVFVCYLIKDGDEMAIYQVFAGGLMLGAFFMATDYATSPVTVPGRVIMGIGCGLLLFLIRAYANYPEGCSFAILFMNVCTPLIDRFTAPHPCGEVKKHGSSEENLHECPAERPDLGESDVCTDAGHVPDAGHHHVRHERHRHGSGGYGCADFLESVHQPAAQHHPGQRAHSGVHHHHRVLRDDD